MGDKGKIRAVLSQAKLGIWFGDCSDRQRREPDGSSSQGKSEHEIRRAELSLISSQSDEPNQARLVSGKPLFVTKSDTKRYISPLLG